MHYLIIDTCVWISFCEKHVKILPKLLELIKKKKATLIVPEIVIQEWDRNKQNRVFNLKKNSFGSKLKNAKEICQYLEEPEAETFKKTLESFQPKITELASKEIEEIDSLFRHSSTIKLPITQGAKIQASELALDKKAPFHKKNSMADALILLTAMDYISRKKLKNCIFISENQEDFSSSNKTEPHEDLQNLFKKNEVQYFINIGQAINQIEENLVSHEKIKKIEEEQEVKAITESVIIRPFASEILGNSLTKIFKNPITKVIRKQQQQHTEIFRSHIVEIIREQQQQRARDLNPYAEIIRQKQQRFAKAFNPYGEIIRREQQRFAFNPYKDRN